MRHHNNLNRFSLRICMRRTVEQLSSFRKFASSTATSSVPADDKNSPEPPQFQVLATNIPTMFTCTPLDPKEIGFPSNALQLAGRLFGLPAKYVPPKEFNYQLPTSRTPEFAFVGRYHNNYLVLSLGNCFKTS